MEFSKSQNSTDAHTNFNLKATSHPRCQLKSPPWFDLKVFYVRVSSFEVNDSTPHQLTLNYTPLGPHSILKVNGRRSSAFSDCVSSQLRRDRVDKKSEEATFVNTDSIEMTGSVRFEVLDGDDILLSGVLGLCNGDGLNGEANGHSKKWIIKCQSHMSACGGLVNGEGSVGTELVSPIVDVYVAGSFSGRPVILTKTLELLCSPKKNPAKLTLDPILENETADAKKAMFSDALQICQYRDYDHGYNSGYGRFADCMEGEDGELSWFNAGVRVGVGIGLGICVGVGLGVGLLVRKATSRNFKRRLF